MAPTHHRVATHFRRALIVVLALVVGLPLAGAAYELVMASSDQERYPPPGRMVDVGGYQLHLHCVGQGGPTVVLSSGAGGFSAEWSLVQPELARAGRVCSYDRAGLGWSEAGVGDHSPGAAADDLFKLLAAGGEPGPYILVGQSHGARATLIFARRHPQLVAGVVLVDPRSVYVDDHQTPAEAAAEHAEFASFAQQLTVLTRLGVVRLLWAQLWPVVLPVTGKLSPEARELIGILQVKPGHRAAALAEITQMRANNDELRDADLGDTPLLVIASSDTVAVFPHWLGGQRYEAARSRNSKLIVVEDSHHMIQWDQPQTVTAAVQEVTVAARAGTSRNR